MKNILWNASKCTILNENFPKFSGEGAIPRPLPHRPGPTPSARVAPCSWTFRIRPWPPCYFDLWCGGHLTREHREVMATARKRPKTIKYWEVDDVREWLEEMGFGCCLVFRDCTTWMYYDVWTVVNVSEFTFSHTLWVGFNIVWSVLYEHREYNHSRLFLNLLISRRPTFRPPASWLQPQTSVGRHCHRAKVTVHACGL